MSGNPFRRKAQLQPTPQSEATTSPFPVSAPSPPLQIPTSSYISAAATTSISALPPLESERRTSQVVKRVRIATPPPRSPESLNSSPVLEFVSLAARPGTPPSTFRDDAARVHGEDEDQRQRDSNIEEREDTETDTSSDDGEENVRALRYVEDRRDERQERPLTSEEIRPFVPAETRTTGMPPNPFQRTLASITSTEQAVIPAEPTDAQPANSTRNTMDVDSFKRLLMTGKIGNDGGRGPAPARLLDGSSTDTLLSRHTLSETVNEPNPDSPRTSLDATASENGEVQDSTALSRTTKRPKPPPPKPRHGKRVAPRTPQTVSFADFDSSEPSLSHSTPQSPALEGPAADFNKPLPVPPRWNETAAEERSSVHYDQMVAETVEPVPQPRVPPPPPLARRTSNKSNTPLAQSAAIADQTQHATTESRTKELERPTASAVSTQKTPPPPPPTRRSGGNRTSMGPRLRSDSGSTADIGVASPAEEVAVPPLEASTAPQPAAEMSSSRSSSISNRASMPPPPPRPRRTSRGSAKEMVQEMHGYATASPGVGVEKKEDILADLHALQAEVDALRNRYDKAI